MSENLYYPRPRHEDYELARLIHTLQEDDDLFTEFMGDPAAFVAGYALDEEGARLVTGFEYDGLVVRGIHPMLAVQFKRRVEWNLKMTVAEKGQA